LHKYENRALLIVSGGCAINCRYCFRRNFPYSEAQLSKQRKTFALDYIYNHKDITEVILSGGDPLILSNPYLSELIKQIATIHHVRRLRIHTRLPCVLPSRINADLIKALTDSRLKVVVVVHINHPNEIDGEVEHAISKFTRAGIPVFNQAVLLRGVNDNLKTLSALFETLFDVGIFPYYMHALDKAKGTQHFEVLDNRDQDLQDAIRRKLPGYLIPRFVREQSGKPYKVPI
jgi:EF-P beta-lysylation protein EpmB